MTQFAVIFDVDGVLVDSYDAHFESWQRVADEFEGFSMTEAEFARTFGRTSRDIIAELWPDGSPPKDVLARIDRRKEESYRRIVEDDFPAMDGARELIDALDEAGFLLAAGSSGPAENVTLALDRLGRLDRFRATVSGDDVHRGKPDPEVFLVAAQRLGVEPRHCAVIEDSTAGIQAANAAGMLSIGLVSRGHTPDQFTAAAYVVHSLRDLTPAAITSHLATA